MREKVKVYKNIYTKESEKVNALRLVTKNMSSLQIIDLVSFYFIFHFSLSFHIIFLFFYFQSIGLGLDHKIQRTKQKDLEQITSYNMDTTCWPHVLHMVVQGRLHSSEHRPLVVVYKVDQFVQRSLSSSLVLLNTRVVLLFNPKDFSS